jgi:hypothetical protein
MEIPKVSTISMRTLNTSRWVASARASRTATFASKQSVGEMIEDESSDANGGDHTLTSVHNAMTLATVQAAYASI